MSEEVSYRNFKCGIASFAANYIAGILHPFDVIRTRFQSNLSKIKVMTERREKTIWFPGIEEFIMLSRKLLHPKEFRAFLKDFTSLYLVKQ